MKKLFLVLAAAFAMVACQTDINEVGVVAGGEVDVTFEVGTPTRAYSDGQSATVLQYAVYEGETELTALTVTDGEIHGSTTVSFKLVTGNKYTAIFWADNDDAPYTVDFGAKTMTIDYTGVACNNEKLDAFYAIHEFTVKGAQTETIELKRPFAQLNIGTNDYALSTNAGYTPEYSVVTVKNIFSTLNLWDATVDGETEVTFNYAEIDKGETFPVTGYQYLAMNYLLVPADKEVVDIEFGYGESSTAAEKTRTVGSVPVQRNYRTNIYGQLLTSDVDINIEIKPAYDDAFNNEGYFVTTDANGKASTATALSAKGLATIAEQIANGTLPADVDVFLNGNIDLAELASRAVASNWTPIGTAEKPFTGTFDGNGFKVSNLVIDGGTNSNIGFFGATHNGEIKNLVIENAKVSGRLNVGVVAGTPYTSKYSNITVTGHVEVDGMAYVGAVGGKNAYANWSNITVDVDETSYVNANSVENGTAYRTYVGGVIGFCGEGGHTFSNIYSNIDVKGSTIDVGGIVGIAHYGNNFVNCVCEGDVEIYNASEEADAQQIGGIAGVWHNENGTRVTFTNCSFTGELKANNGYVINTNKFGKLVCDAYGNGTGVLVIDGKEYSLVDGKVHINGCTPVSTADELVAALEANEGVYLLNDIKIDPAAMSNAYGKTGINVKNGQTIDGGGHTLNIKGAGGTWDSGINTTGGLIKNITVTGSFRGIFINHNSTHSEKVVLEGVTITGTVYTISCDQGLYQGIEATNCTFNGWTSFAKTAGEAKFIGCSFGEGNGYKYCRPYSKTEFVNCTFCPGYTVDKSQAEVTFTDCTFEE